MLIMGNLLPESRSTNPGTRQKLDLDRLPTRYGVLAKSVSLAAGQSNRRRIHWFIVVPPIQYLDSRQWAPTVTYESHSTHRQWHPAAGTVGLLINCTLLSAIWQVAGVCGRYVSQLREWSWRWVRPRERVEQSQPNVGLQCTMQSSQAGVWATTETT